MRLKYDPVDESVTLGIVQCRNLKGPTKRKKPMGKISSLTLLLEFHCSWKNTEVNKRTSSETVYRYNFDST